MSVAMSWGPTRSLENYRYLTGDHEDETEQTTGITTGFDKPAPSPQVSISVNENDYQTCQQSSCKQALD
jgi:hypothetical protein